MQNISLLNGQIQGVRFGQGHHRLLALHGFLDNAYSFKRLAEQLPDVEIWSLDLPGHGLSGSLPDGDGTLILQWLPILGRVLDELDWPEYRLLGHSLGAVLSQLLGALDKRVTALLSLDALGPLSSTTAQNLDRFQRLYDARRKRFPQRFYGSYDELIASREKGMFPLSHEAARVMSGRAVGLAGQGWFHRYDRRLRDESLWRLSEQDVLGWLSGIRCPLHLLVFNTHLWSSVEQVFHDRQSVVPDLNVTWMEGSHHLHLEDPERVAGWVRSLLPAES